jgi:hypothetical protein
MDKVEKYCYNNFCKAKQIKKQTIINKKTNDKNLGGIYE